MHARQALDEHHLLYDRLSNPQYGNILQGFMLSLERKDAGAYWTDDDGNPSGPALAATMRMQLEVSETFFVSSDMVDVMEYAAQGLDEHDRFTRDLWPAESGFLLFEKDWYTADIRGLPIGTRALQWFRMTGGGQPGTLMLAYTHTDDTKDAINARHRTTGAWTGISSLGHLHLNQMTWIADGHTVGPPQWDVTDQEREVRVDETEPWMPEVLAATDNPGRPWLALLMLMGQTIAAKEHNDLRPRNPKHAKRMPLPAQVTVIRLRHESAPPEVPGESQVEYHHRWLVRGHWRRYWTGPDYPGAVEVEPGRYRVSLWINPFVKGPQGAPLVITKKVTALVR